MIEDFLLTICISTINKDLVVGFVKENERFFENPERICIAIYVDPWRTDIKTAIAEVAKTSCFTIIVPDIELQLATKYGYYALEAVYYYIFKYVVANSRSYCVMSDKMRIADTIKPFDTLIKQYDDKMSATYPDRIFTMRSMFEAPIITKQCYDLLKVEPGLDFGIDQIFIHYLPKYFGINNRLAEIPEIKMQPYIHGDTKQNAHGVLCNMLSILYCSGFHRRFVFLRYCKRLFTLTVRGKKWYYALFKELRTSFVHDIIGSKPRFFAMKKSPYLSSWLDSKFLQKNFIWTLYRTFYNLLSVYHVLIDRQVDYPLDGKHVMRGSNVYWNKIPFALYRKIYKDKKTNYLIL